MNASALELIGILAACGSAAAALVAGDQRTRVIDFRHSAAQVAAALALSAGALALLVTVFRRYPQAFAISAFAVLPLRVPIEIGGETANLLVPLYLVIAAAVIVRATGDSRPPPADDRWSTRLRWVLGATLVLYAVQASYSDDVSNAIENIGFFLVPFAVLFALLAELEWSRTMLRRALIAVAVVAAACAAVGIYQYFARDLFLNPELFDANQLHVYFRVNSVFFDPNVFGRYLALALTALGASIAWEGDRRRLVLATAVFALGLLALAFSYSLTSFAALLAGLGIVALLRWRWRGAAVFAGFGLVGLAALAIAGGTPTSDIETDRSIDSGHADLVRGGLVLFGVLEPEEPSPGIARPESPDDVGRPIAGYGSGSFGRAFFEHIEPARTTVSHSEPITVAAEQGVIGLLVYGALLVISLVVMLGAGPGASLARTIAAACFITILIDSFGYTGFTIDPAMWALLGLGVALRRDPPEVSATINS